MGDLAATARPVSPVVLDLTAGELAHEGPSPGGYSRPTRHRLLATDLPPAPITTNTTTHTHTLAVVFLERVIAVTVIVVVAILVVQ